MSIIINQVGAGAGGGGLDTNDATAYPEHIAKNKTAYARGAKIVGSFKAYNPYGRKEDVVLLDFLEYIQVPIIETVNKPSYLIEGNITDILTIALK